MPRQLAEEAKAITAADPGMFAINDDWSEKSAVLCSHVQPVVAQRAGLDAWLALPADQLRERYGGIMGQRHDYLVVSGGGGDGAFGAGLLVGWSQTGTRPDFEIVTGISTGALMAPFAFLGPDYDPVLREVYTQFSTKDLVDPRGPLQIIRGDAVTSTDPLRQKIAEYLNEDVLAEIAAEGRRGRSLLVGTTNLDAGRPVIWDITGLAYIPSSFHGISHEPFDPQYMGRLFRLGYQQALAGNSWLTPDQDEETVADRAVQ